MTSNQPLPSFESPSETGLKVSLHDRFSALLLALLGLIGFVTFLLFLVWLGGRLIWQPRPVQVQVLADVGGVGEGRAESREHSLDEPSPEEVPNSSSPMLEENLQNVSEVVASQAEFLEALEGGEGVVSHPGGSFPSRIRDGVPAWERWEIRLNANDLATYAQQLDFFQVELGIAGGGVVHVDYVSNFSTLPVKRIDQPQNEKRIRFLAKAGPLREADRQLAARAGVKVEGRVVFQFYNQNAYFKLLTLENQRKGKRRISEVQKTVFGVRGTPGNWEFFVIDQTYRSA